MGKETPDFDTYWQHVLDEVEALKGSPVEINEMPIRDNEVSTAYGASFRGVGDFPLFAYFTVPRATARSPRCSRRQATAAWWRCPTTGDAGATP